jgi:hypothetical protein
LAEKTAIGWDANLVRHAQQKNAISFDPEAVSFPASSIPCQTHKSEISRQKNLPTI